jgi:hypothetical protein
LHDSTVQFIRIPFHRSTTGERSFIHYPLLSRR